MENFALETVNLCKFYGKKDNRYQVLDDVNIQIKKGEFVAIMGKSGAGKSTLLNLISTIDKPSEGKVLVNGKEVSSLGDRALADFRRDELGFIFQKYNLLNQMTALENITLPLSLVKMDKKIQKEKAIEIAKMFGIEKLLDKYPSQLSGDEKQRVAAARAIIMEPTIVMADEPTGALDSNSGKAMMDCLTKMNKEKNVTIVMVTHDHQVASYCDIIIEIKDGRIIS